MVRRYLSIVMIVLLVVCWSVPSFAFEATPSNSEELSMEDYLKNYKKIPLPVDNPGLGYVPDASVHTSSDSEIWMGDDGLPVSDFSAPAPYEIDLLSIHDANSVVCYAYTSKGVLHADLGSGYYETFEFPSLTDGSYYKSIEFYFKTDKDVLPDPGTYDVTVKLFDNLGNIRSSGVDNVVADTFTMQAGGKNASGLYKASPTSVTFSGKNWTAKCTIKTNYNTDFVTYKLDLYTDVPINQVSIRLIDVLFKADATSEPALSAPGDVGSAENHIANQSNQIAQNTATMNDTLKEIVQTISKQLEALWNQQYNYIHLEDMANADKNADKIVNSISDNISDQMINDDANTDTIVNGYDNSPMDSTNDQLSSKLEDQAAQEQQIMNQISDPLNSFEFSNPITEYLSTFMLFGDFLQSLFVNSGGFKNVINLSFIMGIALMVAGLYRFKGGN